MGTPFKRVDHADWSLLNAVARHFNGRTVQRGVRMEDGFKMGADGYRYSSNVIEIQATKGNRIQIELYFTYLKEVMERLADEAKAKSVAEGHSSRSFRLNFRKGFANAIEQKLKEQKKQKKQKTDIPESGSFANVYSNSLAVQKRDAIEKKAVDALVKQRYPRLRSGSGQTFGGNGTNAGRAAGRATSVNRQVTRTSTPQLTGR